MTRRDDELLTLAYALLERLDAKDVSTSQLIGQRILLVLSPFGPPIATDQRTDPAALAARQLATTITKH